jgi:hypothetical protein
MLILDKNEPLPDLYEDYPYYYKRNIMGVYLLKHSKKMIYLQGDDETHFIRECNRAKQHSRSLSSVIDEYFIN